MTDPYTPNTEEVARSFTAAPYRVNPRQEGEEFSSWLSRMSIDTMHSQISSEVAFYRWLATHDAQVRAEVIDWFRSKTDVPDVDLLTAREHFALPVAAPTTGTENERVVNGCDVCGKRATRITTPGGIRFCDDCPKGRQR